MVAPSNSRFIAIPSGRLEMLGSVRLLHGNGCATKESVQTFRAFHRISLPAVIGNKVRPSGMAVTSQLCNRTKEKRRVQKEGSAFWPSPLTFVVTPMSSWNDLRHANRGGFVVVVVVKLRRETVRKRGVSCGQLRRVCVPVELVL